MVARQLVSERTDRWNSSHIQELARAQLREVGDAGVAAADATGDHMRESNARARALIGEVSSQRTALLAALKTDAKLPQLLTETARLWREQEVHEGERLRVAHGEFAVAHGRAGATANRVRASARGLVTATDGSSASLLRSEELERVTFDRLGNANESLDECRADISAMEEILRGVSG